MSETNTSLIDQNQCDHAYGVGREYGETMLYHDQERSARLAYFDFDFCPECGKDLRKESSK